MREPRPVDPNPKEWEFTWKKGARSITHRVKAATMAQARRHAALWMARDGGAKNYVLTGPPRLLCG